MVQKSVKLQIEESARDKEITCLKAWDIAKENRESRESVGKMLNELKIRVTECQLGCFGVAKATHEELKGKQAQEPTKSKIEASLTEGRLPCAVAHSLAKKLGMTPREVGDTATLMSIKVSKCQLGCF